MPDSEVAIVSTGMTTSVGLSAAETAASVRAGTARFAEVEWRDRRFQPFTIAEVLDDGLPELAESLAGQGLTYREMRLLRLGGKALNDCIQSLAPQVGRPGLALALPENETTRPLDTTRLLRYLCEQTNQSFDLVKSVAEWRGRAGGVLAIGRASQAIREGQAKFMLAGGIDTYCDLFILGILDAERRVKSESNLDGFIPGEGAGFLLLANREAAERAGLKTIALVSPAVESMEPGHLYSKETYRGDGLAEAFGRFFAQHGGKEPIREVYSSMNGESFWAKEWGVAYIRNKAAFDPSHGMHHPIDCFGDTGAACGPIFAGLAALGIAQGYRKSPCLIYGSSDPGRRAVLTISSPGRN